MAREENIAVFEDTKRLYQTNERLKAAVEAARKAQSLIHEGNALPTHRGDKKYDAQAPVVVSGKRSFEAAESY